MKILNNDLVIIFVIYLAILFFELCHFDSDLYSIITLESLLCFSILLYIISFKFEFMFIAGLYNNWLKLNNLYNYLKAIIKFNVYNYSYILICFLSSFIEIINFFKKYNFLYLNFEKIILSSFFFILQQLQLHLKLKKEQSNNLNLIFFN